MLQLRRFQYSVSKAIKQLKIPQWLHERKAHPYPTFADFLPTLPSNITLPPD
jgi:hypothetical protein